MAEVRVQLPLGAFDAGRRKAWYSACFGSTRGGFKSRRPDFHCGGACVGTGGCLLSVTSQVRFLPPQPRIVEGQANWRWQPPRKRPSDEPWGFDSLTFRLPAPLADRLRLQPSKLAKRVRLPQGTLKRDRGSASGRLPGFEPGDGGSTPPPRTCNRRAVARWANRCGVI